MPEHKINSQDYMCHLSILRSVVDQSFNSNDKDADYNRGILRGLTMSMEAIDKYITLEKKWLEPQGEPVGISSNHY